MSFDALTMSGVLAAVLSAGFLFGVVRNHGGPVSRRPQRMPPGDGDDGS